MRAAPIWLTTLCLACGDSDPLAPTPDAPVSIPDAATPDAEPVLFPAHCENINPRDCLLPWPSSAFLVDDPATATGRRVNIAPEAMPTNASRVGVDPAGWNRFDGFSPATPILTVYDGDLDPANLPDEKHIADSLLPGSPTVILDAASGERVAHFAEIDRWADIDPARRPLYLRPAARLREGRRYIVAIRELRHVDGNAVQPSPYFLALRDGTPLVGAPDLPARRARFAEIVAILDDAGVDRETLIEAWDFETASGASLWGDTIAMRDGALRALAGDDASPRCSVTNVIDAPADNVWRRVEGTVRVPLFLVSGEPSPAAQIRIVRDDDGRPRQNGWFDLPFLINIPSSVRARVAARGAPPPLRDYGHGLFGARTEANSGWFRDHLEITASVGVAIDWWGMSQPDLLRTAGTLAEFSTFIAMGERIQQGLVNHVSLHRAFRDACSTLPELHVPLDAGGAAPAIDPTQIYFYGNSQGGIFGLALAGITVDVTRLVSGVGGMSYSLMIPRSSNWTLYGVVMSQGYPVALTRVLLMAMAQSIWDLGDPSTYVTHITDDTLPCASDVCPSGRTPAHRVLMQIGRDDAQVANVTAEVAARTIGLGYYAEAPFAPHGLAPLAAAKGERLADDALVIFDIPGTPVLPLGTRDPGGDNPAHEGVRRAAAAIEQIDRFMRPDGAVINTCDGICDPD